MGVGCTVALQGASQLNRSVKSSNKAQTEQKRLIQGALRLRRLKVSFALSIVFAYPFLSKA
ncbi:hypothetical protein KTAU_18770 [Thermogemmatispora aurantia]|uniref:Uncharacterized protein n=1 Tax=Thermogemmatispora aurantia TaxID=2045279 RepID=A0A5J4K980_9CHLR|nr:hypothetical protein KTAU_18770 [Thermogemmatispora aurantia]